MPGILLFGQGGQLGAELSRSLSAIGDVLAPARASDAPAGDLSDPAGVAATVRALRPDIVINAAAWTDVDAAERHPSAVYRVNAEAPAALAEAAHDVGAWLVHYSSDYVFDGSGDRPWTEGDTPRPLNVYGQSKLLGDLAVSRNCPRHLIFRSSWLYGANGENFVTRILRNFRDSGTLTVVDDQIGAPTATRWLADLTANALCKAQRDAGVAGLYHAVASGATSRYDYARFIVAEAVRLGLLPETSAQRVVAAASVARAGLALRPLNSRLDTTRLLQVFGHPQPPWQEGITDMLEHLS